MLTRLKVDGFKNLAGVDVRFGAFTCVAGANGVGKSNLFDAISFLSALARRPLLEAAESVRSRDGGGHDVRGLFRRSGASHARSMLFEAEMLIPPHAVDGLGQEAKATDTFARYTVELALRGNGAEPNASDPIEIVKEELMYIPKGDFRKYVLFPHKVAWRDSVLQGERRMPFISTEDEGGRRIVRLHQDSYKGGRARALFASTLPRTVLSSTNAAESPTVVCARREMESWSTLRLDPRVLREPDRLDAAPHLGPGGEHLAAALYRIARGNPDRVYCRVADSLARLRGDALGVRVDRDEKRELLTLFVKGSDGLEYSGDALPDGVLRLLALSVLSLDPQAGTLVCVEEPENGIHPERIPALVSLFLDTAVNVDAPVDGANPLRQVVVCTHSPTMVGEVPEDCLVVAEAAEMRAGAASPGGPAFNGLSGTWRTEGGGPPVSRRALAPYLDPFPVRPSGAGPRRLRVIDRQESVQLSLPFAAAEGPAGNA